MKNTTILPLLLLCLMSLACSPEKETDLQEKQEEKDLLEIGFHLQDEFRLTESYLKSSETNNDLFGIQFYDLEKGRPYAHVVGDDISKIVVAFKKNHRYKAKMTYLRNGHSIIRKFSENEWGPPFSPYYSKTPLNKVIYSSGSSLQEISSAGIFSYEQALNIGRYVELDRYHGIIPEFTATEETEQLPVNLKRMVFGVELNIEMADLSVDLLRFSVNYRNEHQQEYFISLSGGRGMLEIPYLSLGFPDHYMGNNQLDFGLSDTYEEEVHISIGTPENGLRYYDGTIPVNRNVKMILDFSAGEGDNHIENGLDLVLETGEMEQEEVAL